MDCSNGDGVGDNGSDIIVRRMTAMMKIVIMKVMMMKV